uniref:ARAD1C39908p n=1 Tax=Blastobotrys adeninivorans TaxID=409370 RepID=A0A060T8W9_BLAAD
MMASAVPSSPTEQKVPTRKKSNLFRRLFSSHVSLRHHHNQTPKSRPSTSSLSGRKDSGKQKISPQSSRQNSSLSVALARDEQNDNYSKDEPAQTSKQEQQPEQQQSLSTPQVSSTESQPSLSPETSSLSTRPSSLDDRDNATTNNNSDAYDPSAIASKAYHGQLDELVDDPDNLASWLGANSPDRAKVRLAYMALFDWTDMSILAALRSLGDKVYLKAESQQLDKLMDAFSDRWCECNPDHGFKSAGVIYTIAYSILLLNTDHHTEHQGTKKMARSQYIQQTLDTVKNLVKAEDVEFEKTRQDSITNGATSNDSESIISRRQNSIDSARPSQRKRWSANLSAAKTDNLALVNDSALYSQSQWEEIVTGVLKSIYASVDMTPLNVPFESVRRNSLYLHPQSSIGSQNGAARQDSNVSLLHRFSLSRRSSWMADNWSDYEYQDIINSSAASAHQLGKRRSMFAESTGGLGYDSIGFMGALRSTMIQEENNHLSKTESAQGSLAKVSSISYVNDGGSIMTSAQGSTIESIGSNPEEEELSLNGAPWAKEGLLKFQTYLETSGLSKKYKKRDWVQVFVVVQKGYLKMFTFDNRRSRIGPSSPSRDRTTTTVGGGNWLDNATMTDSISLSHSIAQTNPQGKGASSAQWSLTLPSQKMLLFLAGTQEIADEYVYTCNYWAARVSREPLVEAVSNMEYGWDRPVEIVSQLDTLPPISSGSFDTLFIGKERIQVKEWRPPVASTLHGNYTEQEQLDGLKKYSQKIEDTFSEHAACRPIMMRVFQPNYLVSTRAHNNWEKRSQYLQKEIVKYGTYASTLERAKKERDQLQPTLEQIEANASVGQDENESTQDVDNLGYEALNFGGDNASVSSHDTIKGIKNV